MLFSAGTATNSMKEQQMFKDKLLQSMMLWVFVNSLVHRKIFSFKKQTNKQPKTQLFLC